MSTLNDIVALLLSVLISAVIFIPDLLKIGFGLVSLMLTYFFFKYANKYISLALLISFFLLVWSKYFPSFYYISILSLFGFLLYSFFYSSKSRQKIKDLKNSFELLEITIKEFLNILTAFDYLPNKMKIFDELTSYMLNIFPEIYSIAIFQKTPLGWTCKSEIGLAMSARNIYLNELNSVTLSKYFSPKEVNIFDLDVKLEGDEYKIIYNCIDKLNNEELTNYFLKTLLVLSLRFEKKYFLGLENALLSEYGIIHFDVYKKISQTLLKIAFKTHSNVVFSMFDIPNESKSIVDEVKNVIDGSDLIVSMDKKRVLAIFPDKNIHNVKRIFEPINLNPVFAQYPQDGLDSDTIIKNLERKIHLKRS